MEHWLRQFPPHTLREYALLADGRRGVVVGPRGEFAWMCFPGWSDEAVFANLVGGPGIFAVSPVGDRYVWGGYYEQGTLIWRSRWVTTGAVLECREALARPGEKDRAVLLRRILSKEGSTRVRVVLAPAAGFSGVGGDGYLAGHLQDAHCEDGVWQLRCGDRHVRVVGIPDARVDHEALTVEFEMGPDERHDIVVEIATRPPRAPLRTVVDLWSDTEQIWAQDVPPLRGVWAARDVRHAQAVLRGLTTDDGGMVAAATTSLPERAEAGRNYDYRYVWIRDLAMAGQAAARLGPSQWLEQAAGFVTARLHEDGPGLRPAYDTSGGPIPEQVTLDLPGYPGGVDHVGNPVSHQFQLDIFGEALLLLAAASRQDLLTREGWEAARIAATALEQQYQKPDSGVWELDEQHWAHSRLIGAAGLKAMARLTGPAEAGAWSGLADRLVADVDRDCLHPSGRWQRARGDERVDAALIFPLVRGVVPAGDPRFGTTVRAILDELGDEHCLYRFRHDDRPLSEAEGAFLLCGFHAAIAESMLGNDVEAARWFERNRSAAGPSGLLTEEFDVVQRQLRGNLPQAFVHAALIEAADRLSR